MQNGGNEYNKKEGLPCKTALSYAGTQIICFRLSFLF